MLMDVFKRSFLNLWRSPGRTVVVVVMRQRVREIGILKAIGASNPRIGLGFGIKTLLMCLG